MANTSLLGSYGGIDGSALMFRNRIINGDMRIDQRYPGSSLANANGYVVDRFSAGYYGSATGRFSAERSITAPAGFTNSFLLTTTTAQATLGTNDGFAIRQGIEGFNVADFAFGSANTQTITLSFWVRSSQTGVMGIILTNGLGDRTYGTTVTINTANTFEYKTVTIPGDTSGTWYIDNGTGLNVFFGLGAGSGRTIPVGWSGGIGGATPCAVTGQTLNICASLGANIRITGVQLETGSVATPFERRLFATELDLCQRYYEKSYDLSVVPGTITTTGVARVHAQATSNYISVYLSFKKTKQRSSGTATVYNPSTGAVGTWVADATNIAVGAAAIGSSGMTVSASNVQTTVNQFISGHWTIETEL